MGSRLDLRLGFRRAAGLLAAGLLAGGFTTAESASARGFATTTTKTQTITRTTTPSSTPTATQSTNDAPQVTYEAASGGSRGATYSDGTATGSPEASAWDGEVVASESGDGTDAGSPAEPSANPTVDDGQFYELSAALEADILTNPLYTDETKVMLMEQLANDFSTFLQVGSVSQPAPVMQKRLSRTTVREISVIDPGLELREVSLFDPYSRMTVREACTAGSPCTLPLDYNVESRVVRLVWSFTTDEGYFAFRPAAEWQNGHELALKIGGGSITRRPIANAFGPGAGGFHAWYEETDCGEIVGAPCVIVVVDGNTWFSTPPPWNDWSLELEAWSYEAVDRVKFEFDRFGNPIVVRNEWREQASASGMVRPKSELADFFTATIGLSVASSRCTTCHSLGSAQAIEDHHLNRSTSLTSPVVEIPSAVVPGATILGCDNCHGLPQHPVYQFAETRWATPPFEMDIDWAQIINDTGANWSREVCNRIVGTLSTPALRTEHFHEDARLFWAVADATPPLGRPALEKAQPQDYFLFLKHFDAWNDSGARCPQ